MTTRTGRAVACGVVALLVLAGGPADAATQTVEMPGWELPRTIYGHPDLQGNWSNATMTPVQRPEGAAPTLSAAQVAEMEGRRQDRIEAGAAPSDPNREAPPVGGDGSTGAAGGVGGYNYFYIDAGDRVAIVNGEYRSSLLTFPANGRRPALTDGARARFAEARANRQRFGQYDNPENRPLAERCIVSFGSNAGPPMLPNYFYNNNYTIVQGSDHVAIMTEMVHDTRIIPIVERPAIDGELRPWFGDSHGWYEGDTLVVRTTNLHPSQSFQGIPSTPDAVVIERFTRADEHTINYEFRIEDPTTFAEPWGGVVPFVRLPAQVYEYACHEANYAMFNVLSGARAQEREGRDERQER